MVRRWWSGLMWCAALLAAPAWTAAADPLSEEVPPTPLPVVLVTAQQLPGFGVNVEEFPGHATILTAEDIEQSGASTIPELLAQVEGVAVMDTTGMGTGADSTVNLRGVVNSSRTNALVLLDGVRQNRLTGDEVHWQSIPLEQIERIEILRGGSSTIYGEGALAGVINIITKQGGERLLETEQSVEFGSFGHEHYAVSSRGAAGPLTYGTSYTRRNVDGYRDKTNARTTTITTHTGLEPLPGLRLRVNVLHSEDTSYFPGGITPEQAEKDRRSEGSFAGFFDDQTTQVSLDTSWEAPYGLSFMATAFGKRRTSDSDTGSIFASITPSKGLNLRAGHAAALGTARHSFITGIELLDEKASTGTTTATYSESNKASYGVFAEETLRFFDRISVVAGARYDHARFEEALQFPSFVGSLGFEGWSPKIGISADLAKPLTVYANFARPFKAPNVDDFSAAIPGGGFFGNLNLQPQQAYNYEAGARVAHPSFGQANVAWFFMRTNDEILFNDLTDTNENFDTKRMGLETSWTPVIPIPRLTGMLTYTFTEAEFAEGAFDDNTLPAVPEHRVTANLTYELLPRLFCSLDWLVVSDFFRINDFNNQLGGDNYGVLNAGLRYRVKNVSMHLVVENLTNEEYTTFQSSNGLAITTGENPAPPLGIRGGVTFEF